jgi:hypothetical protein
VNHLLTEEQGADAAEQGSFALRMRAAWAAAKALAPYAVIELVLPGGTVLAILCWLYRRRRVASRSVATSGLAVLFLRWKSAGTSA